MGNINFRISSRIRDADGKGARLTIRMMDSGQPAMSTNELMLVLNALKRHDQTSIPNTGFTYVFPFALAKGKGFTFEFPFELTAETGFPYQFDFNLYNGDTGIAVLG